MAAPRPRPRVRFGVEDVVINQSPAENGRYATPSPTHSTSTLDSPELASPVALPAYAFPFACHGSPCGFDFGSLELDPTLRIPPQNQLPLFTYDLMRDPCGGNAIVPPLSKAAMDKPAVTPPLAKMTVVVKSSLQWDIDVRPVAPAAGSSGSERRQYVTVGDILFAVYRDLRSKLRSEDLAVLTAEQQAGVEVSFRRRRDRMKSKKDSKWDDSTEGKRRVDLLGKSHRFGGLLYSQEEGKWVLRVEEP